jgi:hypothetical protein
LGMVVQVMLYMIVAVERVNGMVRNYTAMFDQRCSE